MTLKKLAEEDLEDHQTIVSYDEDASYWKGRKSTPIPKGFSLVCSNVNQSVRAAHFLSSEKIFPALIVFALLPN